MRQRQREEKKIFWHWSHGRGGGETVWNLFPRELRRQREKNTFCWSLIDQEGLTKTIVLHVPVWWSEAKTTYFHKVGFHVGKAIEQR